MLNENKVQDTIHDLTAPGRELNTKIAKTAGYTIAGLGATGATAAIAAGLGAVALAKKLRKAKKTAKKV